MTAILLNIGCGRVIHPAWVNLDCNPEVEGVQRRDLRKGLPCASGTADMCYSSHVLEHLRPAAGAAFLAEQHRALRPGGIVRVVVPDLETICRNFVTFADEVRRGVPDAFGRLAYTNLELYDQTVRTKGGGELSAFWRNCPPELADFVRQRSGDVLRKPVQRATPQAGRRGRSLPSIGRLWNGGREVLLAGIGYLLFGPSGWQGVREGLFRQRGEIHLAMYDEARLTELLVSQGFRDVRRVAAHESRLPGFDSYDLDTVGGRPRKPDSMYVEAVK